MYVDTPADTVEFPQVVLVSNNPYHLSSLRCLGWRFTLGAGVLGAVVIKRPAAPPPPADVLPALRRALRQQGSATGDGVISWSAPQVVLRGPAGRLPAGIDGEPEVLELPVSCEIRPGALRLLLPTARPGVPENPDLPGGRRLPGIRRRP